MSMPIARFLIRRHRLAMCVAASALAVPLSAGAQSVRTALCVAEDIAVFTSRVHIRCNYAATTIFVGGFPRPMNKSGNHPAFFAVSISSPMAAPLVALATPMTKEPIGATLATGEWAAVTGTPQLRGNFQVRAFNKFQFLYVQYDNNDLSGVSFGCQSQDCRKPISVTKVQSPSLQGD